MKIEWINKKVKLSDVKEYEANPRTITEKGLKDLKQSIERFGQAEPLVVNTDMVLIGGHARKIALQSLDYDICDVIMPSKKLTDKQVQELNIRLNRNIAGIFSFDILTEFFETDDLIEWGFESFEFDKPEFKNSNTEIDVNEMEDEMKITLKFSSEDYWKVKKCFEVSEMTPEEVLLDYSK